MALPVTQLWNIATFQRRRHRAPGGLLEDAAWGSGGRCGRDPSRGYSNRGEMDEQPSVNRGSPIELFLDTYPKRAKQGFVFCRVPHARKLTDRVAALPWREL